MLVLLILKSYMTSLYSNTIIPLQGLGYLGSCRISSSHRSLRGDFHMLQKVLTTQRTSIP